MNNPKILIVEDELLIAKDISIILEKAGCVTTIGVVSVDEAISRLGQEDFDLVLIDIRLKGIKDGLFLGRYLLKKDMTPFIYVTSYSDISSLNEAKNSRPYGIIIKPFKAIDVKITVALILNNFKHKNIDSLRKEEEASDDIPFILKNVIEYIDDNIRNKIEINDLTVLTKWTRNHFIKVFSKFLNKTPYQYILKKKIEESKSMLSNTNHKFSQISYELNFKSYSNFCNAFKKVTKTTPEQYRKFHNIKNQIK
jgi:AraC-like DNA-binding protein